MKKGVLILFGMFLMVSTVEAKNGENLLNRFEVNYYSYDNAVNFEERGIEFFIFTNGDFDFDTSYLNSGVRIDRDYRGRIRRIGNVFLNYDIRGNVTRIGNVFLSYYRDRLTRVGNLNVRYNHWGNPVFYGYVKDNFYYDNGVQINLNIGTIYNYNDRFFYNNNFDRNYTRFREDRNFYYYKANGNSNFGNNRYIKRRKTVDGSITRRDNSSKRTENTYRNSYNNRIENSRDINTKRDDSSSNNTRNNSTGNNVRRDNSNLNNTRNSTIRNDDSTNTRRLESNRNENNSRNKIDLKQERNKKEKEKKVDKKRRS
ncbi:MAG: hypothetical protein WAO74_00015 [Polaribacter sp.]|uniref:hypothetical protein n=1 Tax=Polaribacter sp. TaxID=1920175 RepID=UPI003BAF2510